MPAAPTASRAGRTSTSRKWPRRSAKAAGANTARRPCSTIARRTSRNSTELLRRQLARLRPLRARSIPQLVMHWSELQRQDRRPDSGARHADRHAAVESGAGEQGGGDRRADRAVRSQPGQRIPDLFARWRMEQLAVRALADCRRHHGLAAAGFRRAPARRRRLPDDVRTRTRRSRGCMRCATASASSCAPGSRSAAMAATGRACFRSAPRPAAMRRPRACSTPTPAMRSFMKFPPDKIGLYLDWRTQEVGIAAARSGDEATGGGLSGGRHLSRAGADVRPDQRHRRQALEGNDRKASRSASG